jgi:hypothetical protein
MSYTSEQIDRAANISVLEIARKYYGGDVKCVAQDTYRVENRGLGGLEISAAKNAYYNFSEECGGVGALHFLTHFLKMDFKNAMRELGEIGNFAYDNSDKNHGESSISHAGFEEKNVFYEPEHAANNNRVYAYLCKTRKISPEVVNRFIKAGLLYQDTFGNAVFLHKNEQGKTIGAELTGTATDVRFKKNYGSGVFTYDGAANPSVAFVFESGIDLMSYQTLHPEHLAAKFVSMAGLKRSYIAELADKNPHLTFCLCVDNDDAGRGFTQKLAKDFYESGCKNRVLSSSELAKENVKDFNDLLKLKKSLVLEKESQREFSR